MNRLKIVKALLLSSFICILGHGLSKEPLGCGFYHASGSLAQNSSHDTVLVLNPKTSLTREFLLLGGPLKNKMDWVGTQVEADFYNPMPISENPPYVFLSGLAKKQDLDPGIPDAVTLMKPEKCADKSQLGWN